MTRYLLTALLLFGLLSCGGTGKETHQSTQPSICAKEPMAADGIVRLSKIEVYPQYLDEYIKNGADFTCPIEGCGRTWKKTNDIQYSTLS